MALDCYEHTDDEFENTSKKDNRVVKGKMRKYLLQNEQK
jgi:hypothetical protein